MLFCRTVVVSYAINTDGVLGVTNLTERFACFCADARGRKQRTDTENTAFAFGAIIARETLHTQPFLQSTDLIGWALLAAGAGDTFETGKVSACFVRVTVAISLAINTSTR